MTEQTAKPASFLDLVKAELASVEADIAAAPPEERSRFQTRLIRVKHALEAEERQPGSYID